MGRKDGWFREYPPRAQRTSGETLCPMSGHNSPEDWSGFDTSPEKTNKRRLSCKHTNHTPTVDPAQTRRLDATTGCTDRARNSIRPNKIMSLAVYSGRTAVTYLDAIFSPALGPELPSRSPEFLRLSAPPPSPPGLRGRHVPESRQAPPPEHPGMLGGHNSSSIGKPSCAACLKVARMRHRSASHEGRQDVIAIQEDAGTPHERQPCPIDLSSPARRCLVPDGLFRLPLSWYAFAVALLPLDAHPKNDGRRVDQLLVCNHQTPPRPEDRASVLGTPVQEGGTTLTVGSWRRFVKQSTDDRSQLRNHELPGVSNAKGNGGGEPNGHTRKQG